MKVWVLKHDSLVSGPVFWTGCGLGCTFSVDGAVQFVRKVDAQRILAGNMELDALPAEVELPDGDEPRAQSVAPAEAPTTPNRSCE